MSGYFLLFRAVLSCCTFVCIFRYCIAGIISSLWATSTPLAALLRNFVPSFSEELLFPSDSSLLIRLTAA